MRNLFGLMVCILGHVFTGHAQWMAVGYRQTVVDTLYSMRSDAGLVRDRQFYFPEYSYYEDIYTIQGAVDCSKRSAHRCPEAGPGEVTVFRKGFVHPLLLRKDTSVLFLRSYVKNVRSCTMYLHDVEERKWRKMSMRVLYQGFQEPSTVSVEGGLVDSLYITVDPVKAGGVYSYVLGDLYFADAVVRTERVRHPFFDFLEDGGSVVRGAGFGGKAYRSNFLVDVPVSMGDSSVSSTISIVPVRSLDMVDSDASERLLLRSVIGACLRHYPFYKERHLEEAVIGKEVDSIFQDGRSRSYCALVDSLSDYISWRFDDLHFFIEQPEEGACAMADEGKVKGPVRIVDIHDRYYVGANFDPQYAAVRINDEVIAIDDIPVGNYYDSMARNWFKTSQLRPYKKHVVLSALLDRRASDSCKLLLRPVNGGTVHAYTIRYDKKYGIPASFRSVHCEFKEYDSGIAYYKINYWEPPVYLRFINHWAELSRSKGIIIDLRGNGGGGVMSAMQLYAIFTGHVSTFYNYVTESGSLEPVKVLPDTVFNIPIGEKVVIIGDETTACTSEAFIKAMQQRGNVYFIAAVNTVGSLAAKYDIKLPTGVVVHTDAILRKICYSGPNDEIEAGGGIVPDRLVNIDKVEDLRPYEDKLLKEAIKILSADKRD